jgi:hypothetical protein
LFDRAAFTCVEKPARTQRNSTGLNKAFRIRKGDARTQNAVARGGRRAPKDWYAAWLTGNASGGMCSAEMAGACSFAKEMNRSPTKHE